MRFGSTLPSLAMLSVAAIGCADAPTSPSARIGDPIMSRAGESKVFVRRGDEQRFVDIANVIAGFGGFYFDKHGNLTAFLTDLRHSEDARSLLMPEFTRWKQSSRIARSASRQIQFVKGAFDIRDLLDWRDQLGPKLARISGIVFLDMEEDQNRLAIGIAHGKLTLAHPLVISLLQDLKIPLSAVKVQETSPWRPLVDSTLSSRFRPAPGGVQIAWEAPGGTARCTLGFSANHVDQRVFVTASHCSAQQSSLDYTGYYQNEIDATNYAGAEMRDPPWELCEAYPGDWWNCRRTDANMSATSAEITWQFGYLAMPMGYWDPTLVNNHRFRITAKGDFPQLNWYLDKIGRVTGGTSGYVTRTCFWAYFETEREIITCADRVDALGWPGDSGGPVYLLGVDPDVTLMGIIFGGKDPTATGEDFFLMSSMSDIQFELGSLDVF